MVDFQGIYKREWFGNKTVRVLPEQEPTYFPWVGPGIWSTDRRDDVCATVKTPYVGHGHPTLVLGFFTLSQYTDTVTGAPICHPPMRFTNPVVVTVVHWRSELRYVEIPHGGEPMDWWPAAYPPGSPKKTFYGKSKINHHSFELVIELAGIVHLHALQSSVPLWQGIWRSHHQVGSFSPSEP